MTEFDIDASLTFLFAETCTHFWSTLCRATYLRAPMRRILWFWDKLRLPDRVPNAGCGHLNGAIVWKILWFTKTIVSKTSSCPQSYYCSTSDLTLWVWIKCSTLTRSIWLLLLLMSANFWELILYFIFYSVWLLTNINSTVSMTLLCRFPSSPQCLRSYVHLHRPPHAVYISLYAPPAAFYTLPLFAFYTPPYFTVPAV